MFTIIWSEHTRGGDNNRWERVETRDEILSIIKNEGLQNDTSAMIFLPDADDVAVSPADMLGGRD